MSTQPKTCVCKVCGRSVKVTKDGRLALHGYSQRGATNSVGCQGSVYYWTTTYEDIANHCEGLAYSYSTTGFPPHAVKSEGFSALAKKMRMKIVK